MEWFSFIWKILKILWVVDDYKIMYSIKKSRTNIHPSVMSDLQIIMSYFVKFSENFSKVFNGTGSQPQTAGSWENVQGSILLCPCIVLITVHSCNLLFKIAFFTSLIFDALGVWNFNAIAEEYRLPWKLFNRLGKGVQECTETEWEKQAESRSGRR